MNAIAGLVLAGGSGSRLGMGPKHRARIAGRTTLDWLLDGLRPQVSELYLNLACPSDPAPPGLRIVTDGEYAAQGPLAGVLAGLQHVSQPWLACVPVDAVRIPPDLISRLAQAADGHTAAYVAGSHCLMLIRRSISDTLLRYLANGNRSVIGWLETINARAVDFSDCDDAIWSVNTPDEHALAQQLLDRH